MEQSETTSNGRGSSLGPIIGAIVILIVVIIGAFYFWGAIIKQEQASRGKSDDLAAIESDLNATEAAYTDINPDSVQ